MMMYCITESSDTLKHRTYANNKNINLRQNISIELL